MKKCLRRQFTNKMQKGATASTFGSFARPVSPDTLTPTDEQREDHHEMKKQPALGTIASAAKIRESYLIKPERYA